MRHWQSCWKQITTRSDRASNEQAGARPSNRIRSDYPIEPHHSANSESFADRAKFAQMALAGVITKPIQPITLTEEVAEIREGAN